MPNILGSLDLDSPLTPETPPPATTGPLLGSLDLDSPLETDPASHQAASTLRKTFVQDNNRALASGQPLLASRGDFSPTDFKGLRNYIAAYTQGDLELPDNAISPASEARELLRLRTEHAKYGSQITSGEDKLQFDNHLRALARLNLTPASPSERLLAINDSLNDWTKSLAADKVARFGRQITPPTKEVADLLPKILDAGNFNALTKSEREAFDASGGQQLLDYVRNSLTSNVRLNRKAKLLGTPVRDPNAPPQEISSVSPPPEYRLGLTDLERSSTFANRLIRGRQAEALDDADAAAFRYQQYGAAAPALKDLVDPTGRLDQGLSVAGVADAAGAVFSRVLLGPEAMELGDALTLKVGTTLIEGARELQGTASVVASATGSLVENALNGKYDAKADETLLARRWTAYNAVSNRMAAVSSKTFGESPAAEIEAILSNTPDLSPEDTEALVSDYYGGASAADRMLSFLGPASRSQLAPMLADGLTDPVGLANIAIGLTGAVHSITRKVTPKALKDPLKSGAFTDFDKHILEGHEYNPATLVNRAALLDTILDKVNSIPDSKAATEFARRVETVIREDGTPLTPESAAKINHALDRLKSAHDAVSNAPVTPESRAALRDLASHLPDLHPIDQHFALTGQEITFGAEGAALRLRRLEKWGEAALKAESAADLPPTPRLAGVSHSTLASRLNAVFEESAAASESGQRRARMFEILTDFQGRLAAETKELTTAAARHLETEQATIRSWNDYVSGLTKKAVDIEQNGGSFKVPNPRLKSVSYKRFADAAVSNNPGQILELLNNRHLELPGRETVLARLAEVDKQAQLGAYPANTRAAATTLKNSILREWIETARPYFEAPIDRVIEAAPASERAPSMAASIFKRLEESPGSAVELSRTEQAWLNRQRSRLGLDPVVNRTPASLEALRKTTNASRDKILANRDLATEVKRLLEQAPDQSLKELKLPANKALRETITERLADMPEALDQNYVSLAPTLSKETLASAAAFREMLSDWSGELRAVQAGITRIFSGEASLIPNKLLRHELEWADRQAVGIERTLRYQSDRLERMFGRKYSAAERLTIFDEVNSGRPASHEAVAIYQEQLREGLGEALKAGVITPDQFTAYLGADYVHHFFDRADQASVADSLSRQSQKIPAGYRPLKIDPGYTKFRIPSEGNFYVAFEADGRIQSKAGFETVEDAQAYVKSLPPETSVSIAKTWPIIEKEVHGLVTDVGAANMALTERLALHVHDARISQVLVSTGQAPHLSELPVGTLSNDGRVFLTNDGRKFLKWSGTGNRWLVDRFVTPEAYSWLAETKSEYGLFREARSGLAEAFRTSYDLIDPASIAGTRAAKAFLGPGLKAAGQALGISKIGVSVRAMVKSWLTNLSSLQVGGLNVFNPVDLAHSARFGARAYLALFSDNPLADVRLKEMVSFDLLRLGEGPPSLYGVGRAVEGALNRTWRSTEALIARRDRFRTALEPAEAAGNAKLAADLRVKIAQIDEALHEAGRSHFRDFFTAVSTDAKQAFKTLLSAGGAKLNTAAHKIWKLYEHASGDFSSRYMLYSKLVEVDGLAPEAAAHIVADTQQQMHRLPASVGATSRALGGSLYSSFPADQMRRFANIVKSPVYRARLGRMLLSLYGWNNIALNQAGLNEDTYLETQANARGEPRSLLSDITTLFDGVKIPVNGGIHSIPTGPVGFDLLIPGNTVARGISDKLTKGANPTIGSLLRGGIGVFSKFAAGDILTTITGPAITGKDERGQAVTSPSDYLGYLGRTFLLPPGAPGTYEFSAVARNIAGHDYNLDTNRPISFGEALSNVVLGGRTQLTVPDRFKAAMNRQIEANPKKVEFYLTESTDDLLTTKVTRNASRPDGTLDPDKLRAEVEAYYAANPTARYITADGTEAADPNNPDAIETVTKDLQLPKTIRSFKRLPLPLQISTVASWLASDPTGPRSDPDWSNQVFSALFEKASHLRDPWLRARASERLEEAFTSGRLTPASKDLMSPLLYTLSKRK